MLGAETSFWSNRLQSPQIESRRTSQALLGLVHYQIPTVLILIQWQNVEQTSKADIVERKIRVVFLRADDPNSSTPAHNNVNGTVR